ncbi:MAG: CRISPR-associated helicase Cas3' [Thermoprotei archaeon]
MSYSFRLYSHKNPNKLLYEHLHEVANLSKEIVQQKIFNDEIYNKDLLAEVAYIIGLTHDFGKATMAFQEHLFKNFSSELAHHSQISSLFAYYAVREYLKKKNINDSLLPLIAWIVVSRHHTDLKDLLGVDSMIERTKNDLERGLIEKQINDIKNYNLSEIEKIYDSFDFIDIEKFLNDEWRNIFKDIRSSARRMGSLEHYFLTVFLYSVLLDADKLNASGLVQPPSRIMKVDNNLVDNYKEKMQIVTNTPINQLREKAYKEVLNNMNKIDFLKNKILTIELPTGSGKTFAALSFALKLRDKISQEYGFVPKIIYCLPFLSIIDQTSKIIHDLLSLNYKDITSNLILTHHHLSDVIYKIKENETLDPLKSLLLIEGWHSEIIVTTFMQFFHSLITNKNSSARKFHNMINSIVILDEIQTIPHKYWNVLSETLKYLTKYNSWIILMTATMPLIFKKEEVCPLVVQRDYYYKELDRVEYRFHLEEMTLDDFNKLVTKNILSTDKNIMIVLNTIYSSKKTYQYIRDVLKDKLGEPKITEDGIAEFPNLILVYLSSNIIPKHRRNRINKIKEAQKRKIIVSTQVIEAGTDISVDEIYRDFAPLDSIIQTAGRCNRHNERDHGTVNIYYLKEVKDNKSILFSYQIYDTLLLEITHELLKEYSLIKEKDFNLEVIPKYYEKIRNRGAFSVQCPSINEPVDLTEMLENLRFTTIGNCFKLIEDEYYKTDAFVNIDDDSNKILKKIELILKKEDLNEKRKEFLAIRKELFDHVISVDKRVINIINQEKSPIPVIRRDYYDIETGFKGKSEYEDALII